MHFPESLVHVTFILLLLSSAFILKSYTNRSGKDCLNYKANKRKQKYTYL